MSEYIEREEKAASGKDAGCEFYKNGIRSLDEDPCARARVKEAAEAALDWMKGGGG